MTDTMTLTLLITGSQGEPALRMYAWDRVKCFPYQIDLHLPPNSEFLFARIRLRPEPRPVTVPPSEELVAQLTTMFVTSSAAVSTVPALFTSVQV